MRMSYQLTSGALPADEDGSWRLILCGLGGREDGWEEMDSIQLRAVMRAWGQIDSIPFNYGKDDY